MEKKKTYVFNAVINALRLHGVNDPSDSQIVKCALDMQRIQFFDEKSGKMSNLFNMGLPPNSFMAQKIEEDIASLVPFSHGDLIEFDGVREGTSSGWMYGIVDNIVYHDVACGHYEFHLSASVGPGDLQFIHWEIVRDKILVAKLPDGILKLAEDYVRRSRQ